MASVATAKTAVVVVDVVVAWRAVYDGLHGSRGGRADASRSADIRRIVEPIGPSTSVRHTRQMNKAVAAAGRPAGVPAEG